ncbi:hypothetical protein [Actinomadura fibrosa]|uniref:Uncharacterized protein n=1 Tax=Actinomadura fibrosa TaxID=111802 RepID=A0ABW2XVU8_9ACTN|nr:hypothetical protein [Actinomadura fibrosa]
MTLLVPPEEVWSWLSRWLLHHFRVLAPALWKVQLGLRPGW